MAKEKEKIQYDNRGDKTVHDEIQDAYQSGVIEDNQNPDNILHKDEKKKSKNTPLMKNDELEEKNPDDFE